MRFPPLLLLTIPLASFLSLGFSVCKAIEPHAASAANGTQSQDSAKLTLGIVEVPSAIYSCRVNVTLPAGLEGQTLTVNGQPYQVPANLLLQLQMESNPAVVRLGIGGASQTFLAKQGSDYIVTSLFVPQNSESATSESATSESATSESATSESATSESSTSESSTSESSTSESSTSESSTSESSTSESSTSESPASESPASESPTSESPTRGLPSQRVSNSAKLKSAHSRLRRKESALEIKRDEIQRVSGEISAYKVSQQDYQKDLQAKLDTAKNLRSDLQKSYHEHQRLKELETHYGSAIAGFDVTLRNLESILQDDIAAAIGQIQARARKLRDEAVKSYNDTVSDLKHWNRLIGTQEIETNEIQGEITSLQKSLVRTKTRIAKREKLLEQNRKDAAQLVSEISELRQEVDVLIRLIP